METCLERSYDYLGRVCKDTILPREVRLDDPSLKTLPQEQNKAVILDIRGTSIVELPQGTQFLHLRTDYFVWSPRPSELMIEMNVPESVIATMKGKRVDELIRHPILQQLGVDKRYFSDVAKMGRFVVCSVIKHRPS